MEKSFRDILSQFLEGKEDKSHSPPSGNAPSPENHFHVYEPLKVDFQRENGQNSPRKAALRYKSQVRIPSETTEIPSEKVATPTPPPVVEALIPLEKLDKDSRVMVGILLDLGAADLAAGVSLTRVKKAYRRLAKKFHPDRMTSGSSPEKFFRLQKAYDYLCDSLADEVREAA